MDRDRRVLPLLCTEEGNSQSIDIKDYPTERCDAESRSPQERGDIDSDSWELFQVFRREDEGRVVSRSYSDAPLASTGSLVPRKIVRVRPVGLRRMYDLEVSHPKHNFILTNGVITSNSHAYCYSADGFACAYLKHHFPLEWWTSVLRNADKNEINDEFWAYCGHLIDLPDVKLSTGEFSIQNERIRAPLSLLQGVGEGAHKQLERYKPYVDINDFCQKLQLHKENGATYKTETQLKKVKTKRLGADGKPMRQDSKLVYDVKEEEIQVVKKKLGGSALNRRVVYTLIISGAMDSLFPLEDGKPMGVVDQLELFEKCLASASGKSQEPVDSRYAYLDQLDRYQLRKAALPAFSDDLTAHYIQAEIPNVQRDGKDNIVLRHDNPDWIPFIRAKRFGRLQDVTPWPDGQKVTVAISCYIESCKVFSFAQGKKEAAKFNVDFEGNKIELVKWPDRHSGKVPKDYKEDLTGSLCIAICTKSRDKKPFTLDELIVVRHQRDFTGGDEQ